jgi:uncharacterized MAPEG superfamily protein
MARPKGSINKVSANAKDNISAVFNRLGGTSQMATWAAANLTEFYKLYARLVPMEQRHAGPDGGTLEITIRGVPGRSS